MHDDGHVSASDATLVRAVGRLDGAWEKRAEGRESVLPASEFSLSVRLANRFPQCVLPAAVPDTNVLLGLQSGAGGAYAVQAISLQDAPEGGT